MHPEPVQPYPSRISLHIEQDGGPTHANQSLALEAAANALNEANVTLNHRELSAPSSLPKDRVLEISAGLAAEAWDVDELRGEIPVKRLHSETSGWGDEGSEPRPLSALIAAADVLDYVAMMMRTGDLLVLEVGN